jgi:hypothetical protein
MNPYVDRYLEQLRVVSSAALDALYDAETDGEAAQHLSQNLSVADLFVAFIEHQKERWGTGMSRELDGTLGGDGDWARESLGFGLMVENSTYGVYRIWSRPYLLTK